MAVERATPAGSDWTLRPGRPSDTDAVADTDRDAGRLFAEIGMPHVAASAPPTPAELHHARRAGGLWVATGPDGAVVGFVLFGPLDGAVHVEQLSVRPAWGRRGIGRALLDQVAAETGGGARRALTLTTFAEVPFNAPYYARLGFTVLPPGALGPGLRALLADEQARFPERRVAMGRPV